MRKKPKTSYWICLIVFILLTLPLVKAFPEHVCSRQMITDSFNQSTRYMLQTRGMILKATGNKPADTPTVQLNKLEKDQITKYQGRIAHQQKTIQDSRIVSNYSLKVAKYDGYVLDYLALAKSRGCTTGTLNDQFHKANVLGTRIVISFLNGRPTNIYRVVMAADPIVNNSLKHDNQQVSKLRMNNIQKQISNSCEVALLALGVILIVLVFSQPNHQSDTMEALSDVNYSASLFSRSKPRGKELFLLRSTKFALLLLIIGLLVAMYSLGDVKWSI